MHSSSSIRNTTTCWILAKVPIGIGEVTRASPGSGRQERHRTEMRDPGQRGRHSMRVGGWTVDTRGGSLGLPPPAILRGAARDGAIGTTVRGRRVNIIVTPPSKVGAKITMTTAIATAATGTTVVTTVRGSHTILRVTAAASGPGRRVLGHGRGRRGRTAVTATTIGIHDTNTAGRAGDGHALFDMRRLIGMRN